MLRPPSWTSPKSVRGLHYTVSATKNAFGPNDPLALDVYLHRDDPSLTVKKIQFSLDRHLSIDSSKSASRLGSDDEDVALPADEPLDTPPLSPDPATRHSRVTGNNRLPALFDRSASRTRKISPHRSPPILTRDAPSYFAIDSGSSQNGASTSAGCIPTVAQILSLDIDDVPFNTPSTFTATVPKAKSLYRYSIGETFRTAFATMTFTLSVKLYIRRGNVNEFVELNPLPVALTAASDDDRLAALANAGRALAVADAEQRLFNPLFKNERISTATRISKSHLAARRSSNFMLSVDTSTANLLSPEDSLPSPPRSIGYSNEMDWDAADNATPRSGKAIRKRSEQWEAVELPSKSKPKFRGRSSSRSPSPSPPSQLDSRQAYIASALGQHSPLVAPDSAHNTPVLPSSASVTSLHAPSIASSHHTSVSKRCSRRSLRSKGQHPHSSKCHQDDAYSVSRLSISSVELQPAWDKAADLAATPAVPHEILLVPLSIGDGPTLIRSAAFVPSDASSISTNGDDNEDPDDDDSDVSDRNAPSSLPESSPTISFSSFSLAAAPKSMEYDEATRNAIAPWMADSVSPFEKSPAAPSHRSSSRGGGKPSPPPLSSHGSSFTNPMSSRRPSAHLFNSGPPSPASSGSASHSSSFLGNAATTANVNGRRKSSVGFGFFGSKEDDEPGTPKDGSRWGFLRRGSKV